MRHMNFFLGAQSGGVLGVGGKKLMLKKFMRFFRPLAFRSFVPSESRKEEHTQIFQKYLSDDFSCIVTSFPRAKFVW